MTPPATPEGFTAENWTFSDHGDKRHKEFAVMSATGGKDGTGGKVASVFAGFGAHFSWEEAESHARLIAAAPDLLAALEEMLSDLPALEACGAQFVNAVASARAAISRARITNTKGE